MTLISTLPIECSVTALYQNYDALCQILSIDK